jgi:hypothetical protein
VIACSLFDSSSFFSNPLSHGIIQP